MKTIKMTTKKGQQMIESAKNIQGYTLYDVYGSFSQAKENAYNHCKNQCYIENGSNFRIISHNTFGFSVAWDSEKGLRIETPNNSYIVC